MKAPSRILIVEDDPLQAEILSTVVRGPGDYVETVGTFGAAMAALKTRGLFDAVLLDLQLPDSPSERTLSGIATLLGLGAGAVIVVTGSPVDDRLLGAGLDAGALDVVGKDVDMRERLRQLLSK